jgi:hypothetical protein
MSSRSPNKSPSSLLSRAFCAGAGAVAFVLACARVAICYGGCALLRLVAPFGAILRAMGWCISWIGQGEECAGLEGRVPIWHVKAVVGGDGVAECLRLGPGSRPLMIMSASGKRQRLSSFKVYGDSRMFVHYFTRFLEKESCRTTADLMISMLYIASTRHTSGTSPH